MKHVLSLRLQATRQGDVWFRADGDGVDCAVSGLDAIRDGHLIPGYFPEEVRVGEVRVSSSPVNTPIILKMFDHLRTGRVSKVTLVPPLAASAPVGADVGAESHEQIHKVLSKVWKLKPSVGGPRPLNWADRITYSLFDQLSTLSPDWDEIGRTAIRHPAWPAFSFLSSYQPQAAIRLLLLIADPRWYVDPDNPDRAKKLASAFGLGREGKTNMQANYNQLVLPSRNYEAAASVLATWYSVADTKAPQNQVLCQHFPWRIYYEPNDIPSGMLRACRILLKTVCAVWLDNLTPARVYTQRTAGVGKPFPPRKLERSGSYNPQLFVPEYCFQGEELARWRVHMDDWRQQQMQAY